MRIMGNPATPHMFGRANNTQAGKMLQNAARATQRDSLTLSGDYRKSQQNGNSQDNFLQSLIEQKENIKKMRQSILAGNAPTTEGDKKFQQQQLKALNDQMKDIDKQMKDYMVEKQEEAIEEEKDKATGGVGGEGKTREEIQAAQMGELVKAQADIATSDQLRLTRAYKEREAGYAREYMGDSVSLSGATNLQDSYASDLDKLETGIEGLQASEIELAGDAQDLAEKAAELGVDSTQAPTEEGTEQVPDAEQDGSAEPESGKAGETAAVPGTDVENAERREEQQEENGFVLDGKSK